MPKLSELTKVLRSKNAGPFMLTFDLLFKNQADLEQVIASGVLAKEKLAKRLHCSHNEVTIFVYKPANAIKITIPRPHASGAFEDSDVFGCQQHATFLDLEIPQPGDRPR